MHQGTVLVVEDDESIRRLLSTVLGAHGHHVVEAHDGASALAAARAGSPDLVLLDVGLPDMDGFAVLSRLRDDERLSDVPVLMVTAWSEPDMVARALAAGADDYVRKPFDLVDLAARVDAGIRRRRPGDTAPEPADAGRAGPGLDPVTGLPDPRATRRELECALAAARASNAPCAVVALDLDGGGPEPDLLRSIAHRLQARLRRSDVLGHRDGGGFLVIAPDTDIAGAVGLADGLRWALGQRPMVASASLLRVTACLGAAAWDGEELAQALHERGERALESARLAGPDTVRRSDPSQGLRRLIA